MNGKLSRREFLKLVGVSGVATLTANSIVNPSLALPPWIKIKEDRYAIMLLVDGLRSDLFFEMLESGKLPNIKEYLVDRGATMECVSTLPSTTGPAHLPFLTGTLPGKNNVAGIRWVDRSQKICRSRDYCSGIEGIMINNDFSLTVPTLFEILSGYETAAIYGIVNRGATIKEIPNIKAAVLKDWTKLDEVAMNLTVSKYSKLLPRFTFVWLPGLDHIAHFEGPRSMKVREELIFIDDLIKKLTEVIDSKGIYDKTLIGLVSDHGLRDNEKHMELADYLSYKGLNVKLDLSKELEWGSIYRYNAVLAVSGNAFAHVYLCDDEGKKEISTHDLPGEQKKELKLPFFHGWRWEHEVSYDSLRNFPIKGGGKIDLIEELRNQKEINLLLTCRKWGEYLVHSSSGIGLIERDCDKYRYSVIEGDDPLEYNTHPETAILMSDGKFHSSDEWLNASWSSKYVDAILQFSQIFNSERCGDIIVLAKPGYDLMDQAHIGSHGGPEREEMLVPAVLAGPGIVHKNLKYVRTVDVFPAYLKFFGINPSPLIIDGRIPDVFD
jgi:hypothetical protein